MKVKQIDIFPELNMYDNPVSFLGTDLRVEVGRLIQVYDETDLIAEISPDRVGMIMYYEEAEVIKNEM
jgi:hypothetical protein